MNIQNEYTTTDFYLTCYLLSSGLRLAGTQKENPRKTIFVLKDSPKRQKLIQDFYAGKAKVNPLVFKNWITDLKTVLYND